MRSQNVLGVCLACLLSLTGGASPPLARAAEPSAAEAEFFEKEVRPLLVERCLKCHGGEKTRGSLQLTSRDAILQGGDSGPAAAPGKPADSRLVKLLTRDDTTRMPKGADRLPDHDVAVLTRWVEMGLPYPATATGAGGFRITDEQRHFWAFQPVKAVPVPAVRDKDWARSDVDRFVLAALEAKKLAPAAPADKRTLLRRATFDLTGLPPKPAEIDAFLADDSPQAFAKVVDRLLASPQYGERWGRHWLDFVRYADARDLIQLPPESDFREAWRYRDWVVESFNRDLPYPEFIRLQIAGDLLPAALPGGVNKDGLVATGMLAIADFVPGEGDKDKMIADYVNDEIDVVGRTFLGLSLACARCHDHKFDPISTEDYYALSGIFFSTRIIPGPVAGNTPLVRVPLLGPAELAQVRAGEAADKRRRAELEQMLPDAADRENRTYMKSLAVAQTARYLTAACKYRKASAAGKADATVFAKRRELDEGLLSGWLAFLGRVEAQPAVNWPPALQDAAAGKLLDKTLEETAGKLEQSLAALAKASEDDATKPTDEQALAPSALLRFRADDPQLQIDAAGHVTLWPNRAGLAGDGTPPTPGSGPLKTNATINGRLRAVLRFDGDALLEAPRRAPPAGTLFVVFQTEAKAGAGRRLVGWEDSDVGKHGLGLIADSGGGIHAILRNNGGNGDLAVAAPMEGFETVCVTWGPGGVSLHRNGAAVGAVKGIDGLSSDPAIKALRVGGPGSGKSPRFRGDVAEIRVYNRPLDEAERRRVEAELHDAWFADDDPKALPNDPLAELYEELLSSRGPFWTSADERSKRLPAQARARLAALNDELEVLKKKPPLVIPEAVVAQDGGPKGTRFEGFKDAQVFLRGDLKKPGKTVPRGFPRILTAEHPVRITEGSGRLQLADWLARADNPLTARVMVNRIWQHHFGEGLVRTPNDFGERGERPADPELLDYLATRFVASGWSTKQMHRLIMLSSVYQQSSQASAAAIAVDPDNRLFGRMNRRRLEAEAIRDGLLAAAGRLDSAQGGAPFTDLNVPRRTLYLQSARTGANTSDFGRLFDRADPGSIVDRRNQSVVAPQALFFLNDPFVNARAKDLASRVAGEAPGNDQTRIRRVYVIVLGRPPSKTELDLGMQLLAPEQGVDAWVRYCHTVLCTNEFLYVD